MFKTHARSVFSFLTVIFFISVLLTGSIDFVSLAKDSAIEQSGLLAGLWHGFMILPAFCFSLFDGKVAIYAVQNTGVAYDFGFLIGAFSYFLIFCGDASENEREIP